MEDCTRQARYSASRTFYSELARGSSVEDALFQARLTLANSSRKWAIGVPVLYTALAEPVGGFSHNPGTPTVIEHQPAIEAIVIPRAEGVFQGRIDELKQLGEYLTGDNRARIVTIHGSGGQGKTALAREAVERFAYAWPGGVWATTLETLPSKEVFVNGLARFLDIATQDIIDPDELERQVVYKLNQQRTLIVLDNAETLVEAVEANNEAAITLARFIRERLLGPMVCLLVTSRDYLGWDGEVGLEKGDLEGLAPEEGASLFRQSAPQRVTEADLVLAEELSRKVDGHPLSLRLLGGAFNLSTISLPTFVQDCETQLLAAENKYVGSEHRHRNLYACIETSVRYLDEAHRRLFSGLWLFHAPFLPQTAADIFDPEHDSGEGADSPVYDQLNALWRRGLLVRETTTLREGTLQFYRLLPTMRPYIEKYLAQTEERQKLLVQFGEVYAQLVRFLYRELDRGGIAAFMALQFREDRERGASHVTGAARGYYLLHWGWILQRLIDTRRGLKLTEQALEIGQSQDRPLELQALNNMAEVYDAIGQPQRALELYEQALPLTREVGDRAGEAATLNGLAYLLMDMRRYSEALAAFEQSVIIAQQILYVAAEIAGLVGIALLLYQHLNRSQEAITRMEQAITVMVETGLPRDAAGRPIERLQQYLDAMRQGASLDGPATMSPEQIRPIVANTIAVMTTMQDRRDEWHQTMTEELHDAQQRGANWQIEVDFFTAVLDILDGRTPGLPDNHPYIQAIAAIQDGIAKGGAQDDPSSADNAGEMVQAVRDFVNAGDWEVRRHVLEAQQAILFRPEVETLFEQNIAQARGSGNLRVVDILEMHLTLLRASKANGIAETFEQLAAAQEVDLPFGIELIPRSIQALLGGPQEKMEHVQYLNTLAAQTKDEELKSLINTIQLALFGGDPGVEQPCSTVRIGGTPLDVCAASQKAHRASSTGWNRVTQHAGCGNSRYRSGALHECDRADHSLSSSTR
jgi:tetratricopeptide (TPR) repeat protein